MVKIKICGITNYPDASAAVDCGASALGFIFFRRSPRYISPEDAAEIIRRLPPFLTTVGVVVNEPEAEIRRISEASGITAVQLHGDESPELCRSIATKVIKAFRVQSIASLAEVEPYKEAAAAFLLDTYSEAEYGGTGKIFNWDIAVEAKQYGRIILAGGLTPDNIADAVKHVRPYAVDVSSGVEASKGKKDHALVRLFIDRARSAAADIFRTDHPT